MEKELITSRSKVIAAYKDANDDGKKMLRGLYGEELFLSGYQKIKTYEDACKVVGTKPTDFPGGTPKHVIAYIKLCTIAKALNLGWKPDWANFYEYKFFPWFNIEEKDASLCVGSADNGSNVGLSCLYSNNVVSCSSAIFGGALASQSEEIAIYFGKQFTEIWKDYLIV